MKTLASLYRGQFRAVEDSAEAWQQSHEEAMTARDVEEFIQCSLVLHDKTIRLVDDLWKAAASGELKAPHAAGRWMLDLLKAGVGAWESVKECVNVFEERGYALEHGNVAPDHLAELKAVRDKFTARWPFVDQDQVRRSVAEIGRGEYQTAEDVLRELQSSNP